MFTGVGRDGVAHYVMSVWCIRGADMDLVMEVRGNVSVIQIGAEYCAIKVTIIFDSKIVSVEHFNEGIKRVEEERTRVIAST